MDSEKLEQAAEVLHDVAEQQHAQEIQADQPTAVERLRSFEDKVFGKDVSRVAGKVEDGHGSAYSKMKPNMKARHSVLVNLVDAEDRLTKATAELSAAKVNHAEATAKAEGL